MTMAKKKKMQELATNDISFVFNLPHAGKNRGHLTLQ